MEKIFDLWCKRNPNWETRYQASLFDIFVDYGKGTNRYNDARAVILGSGYELFIFAFFIGLYYNKTKPLPVDKSKVKHFGWAIYNWGNKEEKLGRIPYPLIREYMFMALVARTEVDWIALDKGEISPRSVVDALMKKMEEYANFGLDFIEEKLEEDPNCFFNDKAFLRVFMSFISPDTRDSGFVDDEPDEL